MIFIDTGAFLARHLGRDQRVAWMKRSGIQVSVLIVGGS